MRTYKTARYKKLAQEACRLCNGNGWSQVENGLERCPACKGTGKKGTVDDISAPYGKMPTTNNHLIT